MNGVRESQLIRKQEIFSLGRAREFLSPIGDPVFPIKPSRHRVSTASCPFISLQRSIELTSSEAVLQLRPLYFSDRSLWNVPPRDRHKVVRNGPNLAADCLTNPFQQTGQLLLAVLERVKEDTKLVRLDALRSYRASSGE